MRHFPAPEGRQHRQIDSLEHRHTFPAGRPIPGQATPAVVILSPRLPPVISKV
jgi:hypothetical protein